MPRSRRDKLIPLGLGAACYALALLQRPGLASSDTKVDLHVDPSGFLADVASVWTPSGSLGHVQGGQYSGYLWPMGPFFAAGDALGLPPWLVHRLWLGTVLALGAWGLVRLLDALLDTDRGVAHLAGGAVWVLNPYVVVFSNQTSVTLVGWAALPWLLLAVHRGLRDPQGWWWPGACALIFASVEAGVNAATPAWLLPAAGLLLVYEPARGEVPWRAAGSFLLRLTPLALLASAWWIAPALVQVALGLDFLEFTEQQGAIWSTNSLSESLRLMGYWISYIGIGYGEELVPYFSDSPVLLFNPAVYVATLVVPGLALAGFVWTRRWRYGPFFLLLVLFGLVVMSVGFPEGAPLRKASNFVYNEVSAVRFLRTTYKAGPLVGLGLACLAGPAAAELWRRARGRDLLRPALALAGAALLALSAWPLMRGKAVERELTWEEIPPSWREAGADLERELPDNDRALVLPGQLFAFYRWGGTVDPILPSVTDRPVGVRGIVPYADLRAIDLLWAADTLLQQQRLLPGQLVPLVSLLAAGAVVTGSDDDPTRSGAMTAAEAARLLESEPSLGRPGAAYGKVRRAWPSAEELAPPADLPEVRRYDVRSRGIVRVEPRAPETVVDGSGDALAGLAAFGQLPAGHPLAYAADRSDEELRRAAAGGAELVVSDSNRRRTFLSSQMQANFGPTLGADDPVSQDAAVLNPFPDRGTDGQTVATYDGARYIRAPLSPNFQQFPEHRPFAAFDGSPATAWLADRELDTKLRWIEIGFHRPRAIGHIEVLPYGDERGRVTEVSVGGRRFGVRPGWNRLPLDIERAASLRVEITGVRSPEDRTRRGAGGFAEIRVPGLRVREWLRPPRLVERAARGADLRRSGLTYLFSRATADRPYRVSPVVGPFQAKELEDRADPEARLARAFDVPAARRFSADAWASLDPRAPDDLLDRLAGHRGPGRATSSGRFNGVPDHRASRALDGDPRSGWIGAWMPPSGAWLEVEAPEPVELDRLVLEPLRSRVVRAPTRVRVRWGSGATSPPAERATPPPERVTPPLVVGRGGEVRLPRRISARRVRIEVLDARYPEPGPRPARGRRAVGIAEVRAPGLPGIAAPGSGPARFRCGDARIRVGGRPVSLRPEATVAALDDGRPFRARACSAGVELSAGPARVEAVGGPVRVDHLRLRSLAPEGLPGTSGGGRVVDPGDQERGRREGVRLAVEGPSWLVLGESYNRGWRAFCGDRSLGRPEPLDGYANGWPVDRGCTDVRFMFAPNRVVTAGYLISAVTCLFLVALLLVRRRASGWRRRHGALTAAGEGGEGSGATGDSPGEAERSASGHLSAAAGSRGAAAGSRVVWSATGRASDRPPRHPLPRAVALALPAAVALGFLFSIRAGLAIWAGLAVILWRGIGARTLILAAGALLVVVVPLLYLIFPAEDLGGYQPEYAIQHLGAHWVTVAAYVLLVAALWRTLRPRFRHRLLNR